MSRLFLQAIRALPEDWIDEQTQIAELGVGMCKGGALSVIAIHPERIAMLYTEDAGWREMKTQRMERPQLAPGVGFWEEQHLHDWYPLK